MIWRVVVCFCSAVIISASSVSAQSGVELTFGDGSHETSKPIKVVAAEVLFDQDAGKTTFVGSVIVTQDQLMVEGDTAVVHSKDNDFGQITLIEMTGNVRLEAENSRANANAGEYDLDEGVITLTGNVRIKSGDSNFAAGTMIYDVESGRSRLLGEARATITDSN